jgi:putative endonuclease
MFPGFTAQYNCDRLTWFESFSEIEHAIQREKQLKGWSRAKKIALIVTQDPTWEDLSKQWYPHLQSPARAVYS